MRRHTKESESYCFDYSEYNEVFDNIFGVLYEHGLLADIDFFAPKRKVTCCSTRATNEIVVDTKGNLYKCMQTATSDQYAVGTELPLDTVTELPSEAAELGFTIEDYDYHTMPQIVDGKMEIYLQTDAMEQQGVIFQSEDNGVTWEYAGCKE